MNIIYSGGGFLHILFKERKEKYIFRFEEGSKSTILASVNQGSVDSGGSEETWGRGKEYYQQEQSLDQRLTSILD